MRICCPECAATLDLPERLIGSRVRCKRCKHVFVAEEPPLEVEEAAPVRPSSSSRPRIRQEDDEEEAPRRRRRDDEDRPRRRRRRPPPREPSPPTDFGQLRPFLIGGVLIFLGLCQIAGSLLVVDKKQVRFTAPIIGIGLVIGGARIILNRD